MIASWLKYMNSVLCCRNLASTGVFARSARSSTGCYLLLALYIYIYIYIYSLELNLMIWEKERQYEKLDWYVFVKLVCFMAY